MSGRVGSDVSGFGMVGALGVSVMAESQERWESSISIFKNYLQQMWLNLSKTKYTMK